MTGYHHLHAIAMRNLAGVVCPQAMRMIVKIYDRGVFMNRCLLHLYEGPGRSKRPGFFMPCLYKPIKTGVMKFIVMVFMVRFIIELIDKHLKRKKLNG